MCYAVVAGQINREMIGPSNISREEGERNVYIPCPFYHDYHNPIWKINGFYYEASSLPEDFVPATSGLEIIRVHVGLNLTTFQCYTTIDTGFELQSSTEGLLIVTNDLQGKLYDVTVIDLPSRIVHV